MIYVTDNAIEIRACEVQAGDVMADGRVVVEAKQWGTLHFVVLRFNDGSEMFPTRNNTVRLARPVID